jgi:uncharacterized protein (TIGR02453 family)
MAAHDLKLVLNFLSDLESHNNRSWFEEHKNAYEKARTAFEQFVEALIGRLSPYEDLAGVTAKGSMMRIYRDIRFSKDKTPYNAWMAAMIASGGRKSQRAGFGVRLAPRESGAGGGFWDPTPEQLDEFRRTVDRDGPRALSDIVDRPEFIRMFGGLQGEKLKTVPKNYAKDHPAGEFLKLRQVYVTRSFSDQRVLKEDFLDELVATFVVMKPFLDYLNGGLFGGGLLVQ